MPNKESPNRVRIRNRTAEFLTFAYQTSGDGMVVRVQNGTIWLSQKNIGQLFETTPENVLMHLKNIYAENELPESATANEFLAVQTEGKRQVNLAKQLTKKYSQGFSVTNLQSFRRFHQAYPQRLPQIQHPLGIKFGLSDVSPPIQHPLGAELDVAADRGHSGGSQR